MKGTDLHFAKRESDNITFSFCSSLICIRNKPKTNNQTAFVCVYLFSFMVSYFSRIRRNLSIHIARFSASESLRAYANTPKKIPIFR